MIRLLRKDICFLHILFGKSSTKILLGEEAKIAILQYITITQNSLDLLLNYLDDSLLLDTDFKKQLLDLVIQKGYKINENSATYLKQNKTLAENFYKNLIENNSIEECLKHNILSPQLISDKSFLLNYINILSQKGIDNDTILGTLTCDKNCITTLKSDIELFQLVFNQITPENLEVFLNKIFSKDELKEIFSNQDKLTGKLLQISQLYAKDKSILQTLNGKLLAQRYQNIPNYKMQLIAKNPEFENKILGLNDFEYLLYSKMTQLTSKKNE